MCIFPQKFVTKDCGFKVRLKCRFGSIGSVVNSLVKIRRSYDHVFILWCCCVDLCVFWPTCNKGSWFQSSTKIPFGQYRKCREFLCKEQIFLWPWLVISAMQFPILAREYRYTEIGPTSTIPISVRGSPDYVNILVSVNISHVDLDVAVFRNLNMHCRHGLIKVPSVCYNIRRWHCWCPAHW